MSEVRPIDANALKKHKFTTQIANGVEIEDIDVVPVSAIDNTPTVKFSLMPADETKEDAYKRGYEKGKAEGILKGCNTRSKGRWIITAEDMEGIHHIECPFCKYEKGSDFEPYIIVTFDRLPSFCEKCGAELK